MALHAIILSGGHGTRLWPASRPDRPKQFLPLLGERSMFQSTVERMAVAAPERPAIVVAGERHALEIERQLSALGQSETVLLIEPAARDSAPAIAAAAAWIAAHDPEGVGVMVASDHHLPDTVAFATAVESASHAALAGAIVTFGVEPSSPSEAYGYILPGEPFAETARHVARFAEKPDAATARRYIDEGYLWNSGNFVFRASTLLDEFDRHAPEVSRAARQALAQAGDGPGVRRLGKAFLASPKISIDYAVMEKTDKAAVVTLDAEWSDMGAWDAVHAASGQDGAGNAAPPDAVLHKAEGNLVRVSTPQRVAVLGLSGVAVIVEDDAVLVADLAASQDVKQVVDTMNAQTRDAKEAASTRSDEPAARVRRHADELGLWLRASALPLWGTLGANPEGHSFRESLDLAARPTTASRRLRVQGRQTYVYALAGVRGWNGPWRELVELGLRSMREFHRLPSGGYATLVTPTGAVEDDAVMLYDHAFVLLAGAWAKTAGVWADAETEALHILETVFDPRRNPKGGFRETDPARPWQSNPHMHLFETCMAWAHVGDSPRWAVLADELAELSLSHFIDAKSGAVREFFSEDWSPAPGQDGHVLDGGHQFEWAWLLDRWGEMRGRPDARGTARRLYAIGKAHAVDPRLGVAINLLNDDFSVADPGARLWPQTERLKSALRLADFSEAPERDALLADAADAASGLRRYFADVPPGLWRDKLKPDGSFVEEAAPASSLYHIATALAELEDRRPAG